MLGSKDLTSGTPVSQVIAPEAAALGQLPRGRGEAELCPTGVEGSGTTEPKKKKKDKIPCPRAAYILVVGNRP